MTVAKARIRSTLKPPVGSVSFNSTGPAAIGSAFVSSVAMPAIVSAAPRW